MTDTKLIFTKICNSEKNMSELYELLFKSTSLNYRAYLLIGHGTPYFHRRLRKTLGTNVYIISIEDESFEYSWKCMKKNEDVFFIDLNNIKQLSAILTIIGTKISMKFDCIIMNPPYDRSLHLKIVNVCLDFITENGEIVNLSPVRWLQDYLAEYKDDTDWKRFEKVRKSIYSLDIISNEKAAELFQALVHGDLGIYHLNKKGGLTFTNKYKSIVEKVLNCERHWEDVVEHNEVDGIRVKTQAVRNCAPSSNSVIKNWKKNEDCYHLMYKSYSCIFIDGMQNGKWWSEFGNKNKYTKEVGTPLVDSIKFKTVNEASNFENSCWTKFMLFCNKISKVGVNTNFGFLPFMPTYTHPWTDKDFYKYFDFTDDEINQIEEEMNDLN